MGRFERTTSNLLPGPLRRFRRQRSTVDGSGNAAAPDDNGADARTGSRTRTEATAGAFTSASFESAASAFAEPHAAG
jgi:hypothetical protein